MDVNEFIKKVQKKEIDVVEHTKKVIAECRKINSEYHYFNEISEELALELAEAVAKNPKGRLAGLPVSVKDCICVKGVESRAGSRILTGYKPVFDATVIDKIKKEGGVIIGKTSQDEFGFGSFSVNVGLGMQIPLNPFDKKRSCGGSSGGSGGIAQKAGFPHISIGESTGGSIEAPASFCGVIGFCPTYGRVSRYGLMDYANSFDKIGPMAKSMKDAALMMEIIAGFDANESTTIDEPVEKYTDYAGKDIKGIKIGVIKDAFGKGAEKSKISGTTESGVSKEVSDAVWNGIKKLEHAAGVKYQEISLPITMKYGLAAYYLLATAEASTNLAKFCGMRYGKHEKLEGSFNEYFTKVRSMHLTPEAKRRIMLGTFTRMAGYRDAYYLKATKVRTLIIEEYKKAFRKFDVLISPVLPILPPLIKDIEKLTPLQNYMADIMTVGPNLAGIPHASIPVGMAGKLPVGMMLMTDHLQEGKLIQIGSALENE
jgi:aspartyl-tRNA(Asn)/glutamyl-tRNA(Gln) amidotransferase subunit A